MNAQFAPHYFRAESRKMKHTAMTYTQEKLFLCSLNLLAGALSWVGAIMSTGDIRWLLITTTASIIMSTLLAVIFRQPDETIQLVAARCAFSIFGGICLTKYVAWQFSIQIVHTDPIALLGISGLVCAVTFIVGYKALRYVEKRSEFLAKKFIDSKVNIIIPGEPEK